MKYCHTEGDVCYHMVMTNTKTKPNTKTKTDKVPGRMVNVYRFMFPMVVMYIS